jgi:hypothetical protein
MYKKIALTLTLALAMFAGTALQTAKAANHDTVTTSVVKGEKGGKKKKKECQSGAKAGCCASKTAGENGTATSTSTSGGTNAKTCTKGESKCCDKKAGATETK